MLKKEVVSLKTQIAALEKDKAKYPAPLEEPVCACMFCISMGGGVSLSLSLSLILSLSLGVEWATDACRRRGAAHSAHTDAHTADTLTGAYEHMQGEPTP